MPDFFIQKLRPFVGRYDHLVEDRLFFLEIGDLVLEVQVFLFLVQHSPFHFSVQGFHQRIGSVLNLLVGIIDFVLHGSELLPEKLN